MGKIRGRKESIKETKKIRKGKTIKKGKKK
jgi:hypothetical protein